MPNRVIEYRNRDDFVYGSFTVYVTESEVIIRGILKRDQQWSKFMLIQKVR